MEDLLENIQKSTKMEENHKDQLIQVYNGNLCKQMMDLNFCNIENNEYLKKNQPNMEMDNYKDIIQYGIYEISSRLIKFINSEYDYELEMINSNFDKIKVFMKKKERRQLIIQYFLELYEPFHVFEDIIINAINSMVQ